MKQERPLWLAMGLSALMAASIVAGPCQGQTFGSVTIAPGASRQVSIGATYRSIRVCNDFMSDGSVVVTIRTGWSRTLSPGECTQDSANTFLLQNRSGSPALIEYNSTIDSNRLR